MGEHRLTTLMDQYLLGTISPADRSAMRSANRPSTSLRKAGASSHWLKTGGGISNSGDGAGALLGTITLNASTLTDGSSLPEEAKGWMMVRAKVVSTTGGVKSVAACVGEE